MAQIDFINKGFAQQDIEKANAYNILGIIYWRMGNLPQSVTAAQKAIELDPELLDAYLTLGITYEDMGLQDLAFEQFRKAWQRGLDTVGIYNDWAVNFIKMKELNRAILYLEEALKLDPSRPESHNNISAAYQKKNMLQKAETHRQLYQQYKNN